MNPEGPFATPHVPNIASPASWHRFFSPKQFLNLQRFFSPVSQSRIPSFPEGPCKRNQPFQYQLFPSFLNIYIYTV